MTRRRRRSSAFTLIEVMVAVAVMTVGAVGIMALQQAATRGNMEARQMSTATQVARIWLERLQRDALLWNSQGVPAGTRYLTNAPAAGNAPGVWFSPIAVTAPSGHLDSYAFDYFGNDTLQQGSMVYCAQVRLQWIVFGDTLKAEVRAFWPRRGRPQNTGNCGFGNSGGVTADIDAFNLHAVYASTLIRRIPLQP